LEVPEQFAGFRVGGGERPAIFAEKYHAASRGEYAAPGLRSAGLRDFPGDLAGFKIDGAQEFPGACWCSELCWGCCFQPAFVCGPLKNERQKRQRLSRKTHPRSDSLNKFSEVGPNGQDSMALAERLKFALGRVL